MYSTELLIQTLISGVMIGVLYALMALGITFIYSIVRMINWAMGEFYMLGSYIQYVVVAYALGPEFLVARHSSSRPPARSWSAICSSRS